MERRHQGTAETEATGQLLVTTDHEVIMRWAEQRGAEPALTTDGTADGADEAGTLRFIAKGDGGAGLDPVTWEEWLTTFDRAGLRFVYQDVRADGHEGYYRLERPDYG